MVLELTQVYELIENFEKSGKNIASIAAHTGTGKSTIIPEGFFRRRRSLFLIQPTITASTSLAKYMKTKIQDNYIGTAVEGDIKYKNKKLYITDNYTTPLVYCTAGHLRNILLKFAENKNPVKFVDYLFLDEAHTGDLQYDGIMYVYNYLQTIIKESNNPDLGLPALILITATPGIYPFKDSEIYKAEYPGISYPVEITYHNKDYTNLKGKEYQQLFEDVVKVVIEEHLDNPVKENENDAWLVFCPGKAEIINVVEELKKHTKGTIIIPLYSSMNNEIELQYDMIPPDGIRKIIVSTNVAEASITIDGLSYVFDTLVEKTTIQNKNGATMLVATNISKSSARQRKGRAGRTKPGRCYRMCTELFFESLEDTKKREIERISPDGLILDLISRHLEIEEIVNDGIISTRTLKEAKKRLSSIGLITDDLKSATKPALWVKTTPLSPRSGMFFWLWSFYSEYNPFIGAVLTAVIETYSGSYFYIGDEDPPLKDILLKNFLPVVNNFRESIIKTSYAFNIHLIIYIISTFETIEPMSNELKSFCLDNNLNNAKIKECLKLIKMLSLKTNIRGSLEIGMFDIDTELIKAGNYLYQCFSDLSYKFEESKRHKIKSEIDFLLDVKDRILSNDIIIPISSFETEYRTFVSMYHIVNNPLKFKIAPVE